MSNAKLNVDKLRNIGLNGKIKISLIDSETSSDGEVITSDGAGNATWTAGGGGSANFQYHQMNGVGGQLTYNVPFTYSSGAGKLNVFINGVMLSHVDFVETSDTSFTLNDAVQDFDNIQVMAF